MRLKLLAFLFMLTSAPTAYAGAWLQPKGDGLFIGQASYFTSDHYFDRSGNRQSQSRFSKYEFQPYAEYGLCDNLTIGGSAYAQRDSQSGRENYGVADAELFARTALWRDGKQILSIQPLVKLPSAYANSNPPRGGSRSTDAELSLLYGRNVHIVSDRDYVDLRAGYRVRTNHLNDQWRADAAIGLQLSEHWQLIPAVRAIKSTSVNDMSTFSENGDMDYDLVKAEVTAAYRLSPSRSVQMTVSDHLAGRQVGDGTGISIGFAQTF